MNKNWSDADRKFDRQSRKVEKSWRYRVYKRRETWFQIFWGEVKRTYSKFDETSCVKVAIETILIW